MNPKRPIEENQPVKRNYEKETTQNFLKSEKGFKLLQNNKHCNSTSVLAEIDRLVDSSSTWTGSFPVKKNLKLTKNDFLKHADDFCLDKENANEIDKIVKDN